MDLTQGFKKLYDAIPSIKFRGTQAAYTDTAIYDAGYFGSSGVKGRLVLPDTPVCKPCKGEIKPTYDSFFQFDRETTMVMRAKPAEGNRDGDIFAYYLYIPCAYDMPTDNFMDSRTRYATIAYKNHFYFSYLYLLHYGEAIVHKVQEYLMQDIDNPMDRSMKRPEAEKVVQERRDELNTLFKKEFVEKHVVPYYETHQSEYDFDMHSNQKAIYERVINDSESLEVLGISRGVDPAKVIRKFGTPEVM